MLSSSRFVLRRTISRRLGTTSIRLVSTSESNDLTPKIQLPKLPHLENDASSLKTLFSRETVEDVYVKFSNVKLDDLKFAIEESPRREILESHFINEIEESNNDNSTNDNLSKDDTDFFDNYISSKPKTEKSDLKNFVSDEYYLETNNPIIDQYYKVLKDTAKKPQESVIFQNASSIYNSYYFLSSLKPNNNQSIKINKPDSSSVYFKKPDIYKEITNIPTPELLKWINSSFGSLKEFKTLLFNTSLASRGSGYTWLLLKYINPNNSASLSLYPTDNFLKDDTSTRHSTMVIVNTYNDGVPHQLGSGQISTTKSFYDRELKEQEDSKRSKRRQVLLEKKESLLENKPFDYKKNVAKIDQELEKELSTQESKDQQQSEFLHPDFPILTLDKALDAMSSRSTEYYYRPIFSIANAPGFYLRDYGVYGKEEYLENVWNHLDWEALEERLMGQYKK